MRLHYFHHLFRARMPQCPLLHCSPTFLSQVFRLEGFASAPQVLGRPSLEAEHLRRRLLAFLIFAPILVSPLFVLLRDGPFAHIAVCFSHRQFLLPQECFGGFCRGRVTLGVFMLFWEHRSGGLLAMCAACDGTKRWHLERSTAPHGSSLASAAGNAAWRIKVLEQAWHDDAAWSIPPLRCEKV